MSLIDVTDVLFDPMVGGQTLKIYRQLETMVRGRAVVVPTLVVPAPVGNVQPLAPSPLIRGTDQQNLPRMLEVFTPFRLRSASENLDESEQYQPDILVWPASSNDQYLIMAIDDWSQYGQGWIRGEAHSIKPIDLAPL